MIHPEHICAHPCECEHHTLERKFRSAHQITDVLNTLLHSQTDHDQWTEADARVDNGGDVVVTIELMGTLDLMAETLDRLALEIRAARKALQ